MPRERGSLRKRPRPEQRCQIAMEFIANIMRDIEREDSRESALRFSQWFHSQLDKTLQPEAEAIEPEATGTHGYLKLIK